MEVGLAIRNRYEFEILVIYLNLDFFQGGMIKHTTSVDAQVDFL